MRKNYLLFLWLFCIPLCVLSQNSLLEKNVEIEISEGTLGQILDEVSRKGGFTFSYSQDINREKYFKLTSRKQTVQEFLNEIFGESVYCIEYGNKLILKHKPELPENYSIKGQVVDAKTNEAIPGVTVYVPDTEPVVGTISDRDGFFELVIPTSTKSIRLSCIGYKPKNLNSENNSGVAIKLHPERLQLQEVEIVYYRKPKTETVNGAVSNINTELIRSLPESSIEHILQGSTSGVHVVRNSGIPGASLQVKIRGINSLINSNPSYYLDGVYIQQASLYSLSPKSIESVEILKDASGTAKYGASAGNGVILINSRKGKTKDFSVQLDYYIGKQKVWKTPDLLTTPEFIEYYNLVEPDGEKYDTLRNIFETNWIDVIFHDAQTEELHLSISGGNEKSTFYFSSGYFAQAAIIKKLELKRYSFTLNSNHDFNSRFSLGQNLALAFLDLKGLKEGAFLNDFNNPILGAMLMPPMDSIGFLGYTKVSDEYSLINPYDDVELSNNSRNNYSLISSLNAQVMLIPSLKYSSRLGVNIYFQDNKSFIRHAQTESLSEDNHILGHSYNIMDLALNWQHNLNYAITFSSKHSMSFNLNFEIGQSKSEWIPITQKTFINTLNNKVDTTDDFKKYRSGINFSSIAYTGSLQYIFKERYFFNFDIRKETVGFYYDNLIRFSDYYPSLSAGWIFTKEKFLSSDLLSYGKLRYGWGRAGNSPHINYSFFASMMRNMEYVYAFNSSSEITHSYMKRQTNEKFFWEAIESHNIGLDLGLFRNQLFLSVDYFNSNLNRGEKNPVDKPKDLIQVLNNMGGFGIIEPPLANVRNSGFDWEIVYKYANNKLAWNIGFSLTHLKNKVIDIDEGYLANTQFGENIDIIQLHRPGNVAGSFYGYKIQRLFTLEDTDEFGRVINQPYTIEDNKKAYAQPGARAGDYMFVDVNKDGVINADDKINIGNPFPDFTFGVYCDISYKNIDVSALIQGSYGNEIFNATKMWLYNPYGVSNWTRDITNSYREPSYDDKTGELDPGNTTTTLHRYDYENTNKNLRVSDFYIEDGSYLRLKNVMLGYTLPQNFTGKVHIQKLRFYVAAQNLFTWTNYSGMDPEIGGWGIDCGSYPQPRVYMGGVNVVF